MRLCSPERYSDVQRRSVDNRHDPLSRADRWPAVTELEPGAGIRRRRVTAERARLSPRCDQRMTFTLEGRPTAPSPGRESGATADLRAVATICWICCLLPGRAGHRDCRRGGGDGGGSGAPRALVTAAPRPRVVDNWRPPRLAPRRTNCCNARGARRSLQVGGSTSTPTRSAGRS